MNILFLLLFIIYLILFIQITQVNAHEAYVLSKEVFDKNMNITTSNSLEVFLNPTYLPIIIVNSVVISFIYVTSFLMIVTNLAKKIDKVLLKLAELSDPILRYTFSIAILLGLLENSYFGPELGFKNIFGAEIVKLLLIVPAGLFIINKYLKIASTIFLVIFIYLAFNTGIYILTYTTFLGIAVYTLIKHKYDFAVTILRIFTGFSLIYTSYSIKIMHQTLTINVFNQYNLGQVFPFPAEFVAAGAAVAEISVGLFILFGFATRLTAFLLFIILTLSLIYFKEALWPHLIIFGLGYFFITNSPVKFSVDYYLIKWIKGRFKLKT